VEKVQIHAQPLDGHISGGEDKPQNQLQDRGRQPIQQSQFLAVVGNGLVEGTRKELRDSIDTCSFYQYRSFSLNLNYDYT